MSRSVQEMISVGTGKPCDWTKTQRPVAFE
jgi:hypothetical protein